MSYCQDVKAYPTWNYSLAQPGKRHPRHDGRYVRPDVLYKGGDKAQKGVNPCPVASDDAEVAKCRNRTRTSIGPGPIALVMGQIHWPFAVVN